jgi:uncharacterized surface anchored protein
VYYRVYKVVPDSASADATPSFAYASQEEALALDDPDSTLAQQGFAVSKVADHPEANGQIDVDGTVETSLFVLDAASNWTKTFTDLDDGATYFAVEVGVTEGDSSENALSAANAKYIPSYSFDSANSTVTISNGPTATGMVTLRKIDGKSRKALSGAVFDIRCGSKTGAIATSAGTPCHGLTSDETGIFFVGTLPTGTYWVHETTAPEGYENDRWFTFEVKLENGKAFATPMQLLAAA